jgi:hypothetical protein
VGGEKVKVAYASPKNLFKRMRINFLCFVLARP